MVYMIIIHYARIPRKRGIRSMVYMIIIHYARIPRKRGNFPRFLARVLHPRAPVLLRDSDK